jgi:hypothetical protein
MTEPHPPYNTVTDCREPTPDQVQHAFDNSHLLNIALKDEIRRLHQTVDALTGQLMASQDTVAHLLAELKAAQDRVKAFAAFNAPLIEGWKDDTEYDDPMPDPLEHWKQEE